MKNKTLKLTMLGIGMLGILGFAYGVSRNNTSNKTEYAVNNGTNTQQNTQVILKERAEAIALKEVPGANESNIVEMELDREHGKMIYEIEIQYNNTKHEFDIDATTGEILKKKVKTYYKNY